MLIVLVNKQASSSID